MWYSGVKIFIKGGGGSWRREINDDIMGLLTDFYKVKGDSSTTAVVT